MGDEQELTFGESDTSPFWLNEEDKVATKNDVEEGPIIKKELFRCKLLIELRKKGYDTTTKKVFETRTYYIV